MHIGVSAIGAHHAGAGVDRYLFCTLQHMVASDHSFTIFAHRDALPVSIAQRSNVTVVEVGEQWQFGIRRILWHQTSMLVQSASRRLDVMWIPNNRLIVFKNVPIVLTIHDLAEFAISGKYDAARMFYRRYLMRAALRRADAILTVSYNSANDLRRIMGVPANKVVPIHLGVDPVLGASSECDLNVLAQYGVTSPFALYVGRLEDPGKNLPRTMDAVAKANAMTGRPLDLVIIGRDSWRSERIYAHARTMGYDFVKFLGYVPDEQLGAFYRHACALLLLSFYEGFGLPPLEAMMRGTPVICSNRSSMPEVVGDAGVLVDPEDVLGAASALASVQTEAKKREKMRQRGLERSKLFRWDETATSTLHVLEGVVAQNSRNTTVGHL